jgi:hypothetical protein
MLRICCIELKRQRNYVQIMLDNICEYVNLRITNGGKTMSTKKTKAIFDKYDMTEDRFWQLVGQANWPENGYDRPKLAYLMNIKAKEGKDLRNILSELWNALDTFVDGRYEGMNLGDDSYSDLMFHIIGLGKAQFYAHLSSYKKIKARANGNYESDEGFEESFGYAIPYCGEWDNIPDAIKEVEDSIKRREEKTATTTDEKLLDIDDVIEHIHEGLMNANTEYITEIYNNICFDKIEYVGDSVWKVKEEA